MTLLGYISINWHGRALATREIVANLIGATTPEAGLKIRAALDEGIYPIGKKVTDEKLAALNLNYDKFQPRWNYSIGPK